MIDIAIPSSSWNFPKAIATALPNTIKSIHIEMIGNANESITELDKFFDIIINMKKRRNKELGPAEKKLISNLYKN